MSLRLTYKILIACLSILPASAFSASTEYTIYPSANPARAVAIVIHGLNNSPEVMLPLISVLTSNNITVLNLTLSGHEKDPALKHNATPEAWFNNLKEAYSYMRSTFKDLPIYNLSFSTGSAVTTYFLENEHAAAFDKMIFLAPALSLRTMHYPLRLLTPLGTFNLGLPSFMPSRYLRFRFPSLNSYGALFSTVDRIEHLSQSERIGSFPTQIFISPEDEFVSFHGLKDWVHTNKLTNWSISEIENAQGLSIGIKHLIIDQSSMGQASWDSLVTKILSFVGGN